MVPYTFHSKYLTPMTLVTVLAYILQSRACGLEYLTPDTLYRVNACYTLNIWHLWHPLLCKRMLHSEYLVPMTCVIVLICTMQFVCFDIHCLWVLIMMMLLYVYKSIKQSRMGKSPKNEYITSMARWDLNLPSCSRYLLATNYTKNLSTFAMTYALHHDKQNKLNKIVLTQTP